MLGDRDAQEPLFILGSKSGQEAFAPHAWLQYDGVRPVLEGTLSGDTYTTTAKYVWEGNSYYDPLLFALEGGAWKHPMTDGLGSTRQLLDNATQEVTDEYEYEAFGNLMSSSGSTPNPYKYVGALGYYQTGSSLQHLGARYYLPEVGRFTAVDPIRQGMNCYAYVSNNPVTDDDPTGLLGDTDCWICKARYNRCISLALGRLGQCLSDELLSLGIIGWELVACLVGCAVVCALEGEFTWPFCAAGCAIGMYLYTIYRLVRAGFRCVGQWLRDRRRCGQIYEYCPHDWYD